MTKKLERPQLYSLQILRAFAALVVVHVHTQITYGWWHTPGTFGVDIFFTVSGFVMAMICANEGDFFLLKRLTRIIPPYWVATLLSYAYLIASPHIDPTSPRGMIPLLKSLFFIPYPRTNGALEPVLGVGWTLNYEMCFYLTLSLALLVTRKRADILAAAALIVLMLTAHWIPNHTYAAFLGNPILLEFVGGVGAFHVYRTMPEAISRRLTPLLVAVLPILIVGLCWYEGTRFYSPGGTRLWMGALAFLLLQSVVLLSRGGHDQRQRLLVLIGDASYTLYLFHLMIISIFHHAVTRFSAALTPARPVGCICVVILSTALAIVFYTYVERPFHIWLNRRLMPPKKAVVIR